MQQLGLLARGDGRRFARPEIKRGERTQPLAADCACAARADSSSPLGSAKLHAGARTSEWQHDGLARDVGILALRPVLDRLREITDHAGDELAVATVVERAFELIADLLEIVPVAGRVEIAGHLTERELEVVERAGLAFHPDAAVECAARMPRAAVYRDLVGCHDLLRFLLLPLPPR